MRYVVGIDGGGTKTTAAVFGEGLGVLGHGMTGPANYRSIGMEAASTNIAEAVSAALGNAGIVLSQVDAICTCLAGFDTELDLPVPQRAFRLLDYDGPTILENDVVGAWAGATEAQPGIVVIAGTGATALGMNARGDLWRVDGWDFILGDAGSGYAIGLAAIRAAMAMFDGRLEPTPLVEALATAYGIDSPEAMRRLVDSTHFGKFEISSFASHVAATAERGDPVAQSILAEAGHDLGTSAVAIVHKLEMSGDEFPVSTVGSVFKATPWVTEPFRDVISQAAPHATYGPPLHPPEEGAAILALNRLDDGDTGSWTLGTGKRRIRRGITIGEARRA